MNNSEWEELSRAMRASATCRRHTKTGYTGRKIMKRQATSMANQIENNRYWPTISFLLPSNLQVLLLIIRWWYYPLYHNTTLSTTMSGCNTFFFQESLRTCVLYSNVGNWMRWITHQRAKTDSPRAEGKQSPQVLRHMVDRLLDWLIASRTFSPANLRSCLLFGHGYTSPLGTCARYFPPNRYTSTIIRNALNRTYETKPPLSPLFF